MFVFRCSWMSQPGIVIFGSAEMPKSAKSIPVRAEKRRLSQMGNKTAKGGSFQFQVKIAMIYLNKLAGVFALKSRLVLCCFAGQVLFLTWSHFEPSPILEEIVCQTDVGKHNAGLISKKLMIVEKHFFVAKNAVFPPESAAIICWNMLKITIPGLNWFPNQTNQVYAKPWMLRRPTFSGSPIVSDKKILITRQNCRFCVL